MPNNSHLRTYEFTAFIGSELLAADDDWLNVGDAFVMPVSASAAVTVQDNDGGLSGDAYRNEIGNDRTGQRADIVLDGETVHEGVRIYAERYLVLEDQDGNRFYLIDVEVSGVSETDRDDFFAFLGDVPPPGAQLTVVDTGNVVGNWVRYRELSAGLVWQPDADGTFTIEAEDMALRNYREDDVDAASGGQVIRLRRDEGEASFVFGAEDGFYDFRLAYIDENDGEGAIEIYLNGVLIETIDLTQNNNGNGGDGSTISTHVIDGLSLKQGDEITLKGTRDAWEFARIDAVTFTQVPSPNAPVITSDGGGETASIAVAENTGSVTTVMAEDADGETPVFRIVGGADAALFSIDADTGGLTFNTAPDFETPADADADNLYEVTVEASDGFNIDTQTITVTVGDENDNAPIISSSDSATVGENTQTVLQVIATDADTVGGPLEFSITGNGADDALFTIDNDGNLSFVNAPDFETPGDADADNVYEVEVQVTDGVTPTTQTIAVTVTNVNEAPVAASDADSTAENTILTVDVLANDTDVDAGDGPATFSLDSIDGVSVAGIAAGALTTGSVTIDGNQVRFDPGTDFDELDVGDTAMVTIDYTMSDDSGAPSSSTLTVEVTGENDAPILIASLPDPSVAEESGGFELDTGPAFADADASDTLTFSATLLNGDPLPTWMQFDSVTGRLSGAPLDGDNGTYTVVVTATDTSGQFVSDELNVVVEDALIGSAVDGYIAGATVFADANMNGVLDGGEAFTTTNADGDFSLVGGAGPLVLFGGVDVSTGLAFKGQLRAPEGSTVLTPLTTLMAALIDSGAALDASAAQAILEQSLDLPSGVDLSTFDPVEAAAAGDPVGAQILATQVQVQNTVVQVAALVEGAGQGAVDEDTAIDVAFDSLAADLAGAGGPLPLDDPQTVETLITDAAVDAGIGAAAVANTAEDASTVIAASNEKISELETSSPDNALLTEIAKVAIVAQGDAADALADAGENDDASNAEQQFTGSALNGAISAAASQVGDVDGGSSGTANRDTLVGGDGTDLIEGLGGNDVIDAGGGADTIVYTVGDGADVIDGGLGDDTLVINGDGSGNVIVIDNVDNDGDFASRVDGVASSVTGIEDIEIATGDGADSVTIGANLETAGVSQNTVTTNLGDGDDVFDASASSITQVVNGGAGNDSILSGSADDVIDGGADNDTLDGGAGNDLFLYVDGSGNDTIENFQAGVGTDDVLEIGAFGFVDLAGVLAAATELGSDVVIALDADDSVTLLNVQLADLHEDDFQFDGANDAPEITIEAGDSASVALDETDAGLTASGTLTVADPDLNDSVDAVVLSVTAGGTAPSAGRPDDAMLLAMLNLGPNPVIDGTATTGTIAWDFDSGAEAFDYLGFGQTLVLDYTLQVSDGAETDIQTVTVTITGSFSLADLDGTNGFRIDGIDGGDVAGGSVSTAGDVNGDGFDDIFIGAYRGSPGGEAYAGESYVVFGAAGGFSATLDLATLDGTNGFRLDGIDAGDFSGRRVSTAGDVNGDGFSDLIIGAVEADPNGEDGAGESYVVFGAAGGFAPAFDLATLDGSNGFRLDGVDTDDISGFSVSSAGDMNGDGFDDIIVGARRADPDGFNIAGESYVVFGAAGGFPAVIDLGGLNGNDGFRIAGLDAGDSFGYSVSGAGDVNGDGFADLVIGASGIDPDGNNAAGGAYVLFGGADAFGSSFDLSTLDGSNGFRLDGVDADDNAGVSVSSAGDVNGDGFDDLIVGAREADPGGEAGAGESYVVFGAAGGFAPTFDLSALDGTNGFRLDGIDADDTSGFAVSGAGDFNGDGFDDLIIGAFGGDPNGNADAGETYVVFGAAGGFSAALDLSALDGTNGFRIDGIDPADYSGPSVNAAGDVNGDGFDDLIIGAPLANAAAGESYVIFGGDVTGAVTYLGNDANDTLTGTAAAESFVGGRGNDLMIGGGGLDVFRGGAGDDIAVIGPDGALVVDLGSGIDTVNIDALGPSPFVSGALFVDVEKIDLSGSTANTLALSKLDLLNLSSTSNTVLIKGDAADSILLKGFWGQGADVINPMGETGTYQAFSLGQATVLVEGELTVTVGFPSVISLADLTGANGFRLDGIDDTDVFGQAVSSAGDFNGDGFDDIIVSAARGDPDGNEDAGESYIVFGTADGFPAVFDPSSLDGSNGFRLDGIGPGNLSGIAVSGAGDVNGDGFGDVIIGAAYGEAGGNGASGESYVVFGAAGGFAPAFDLSTLDGSNGFRLDGIDDGDFAGINVSGAGDVNGDGLDDVIISAFRGDPGGNQDAGESYVVFGAAEGFAAALDLGALNGSNGFRIDGIDAGDALGASISNAGDINGDGFDDLIVGAIAANGGDGASYVVFGAAGGFGGALDLSTLNGDNGFRIDALDGGDALGASVSGAGDVNGDGIDDLIVGAANADPGGKAEAGETYVVFGGTGFSATLDLEALDGSNGFRLDGIDAGDGAGISVSDAGDFNGDGVDDLIIGAARSNPGGSEFAGESYVVFGTLGGFAPVLDLSTLDGTNGFRLEGVDAFEASGISVNGAGDINGDGFDDLIIGTLQAGPGAGESYVILGGDVNGAVAFLGGDADDTLTGTVAAESFVGGLGNDLMVGGGGLDAFRGGAGDDIAVIGADGAIAVDLGSGIDTVNVDALGPAPSFSGTLFVDVEKVDLGGSTANTLTLGKLDVLGLSSTSNTVLIKGDASDAVVLDGLWTQGADIVDPLGETGTYTAFSLGQATVLVESEVAATVAFPTVISLADLDGNNGFRLDGIDGSDISGRSVSSAGDVNGDGFDDIIIGAVLADPNSNSEAGESYVVFGAAGGFPAAVDLSTLDGTNGFRLDGIDVSDRSGVSVSSAGDVNGDGFGDLIIGAVYGDPGGSDRAGETYVVFGAAGGFAPVLDLSTLDGTNGVRFDGIDDNDVSGYSVSGVGDFNGDGFDDVIIGAARADPAGNAEAGESYVIFGGPNAFPSDFSLGSLNGTVGFRIGGVDPGDYSGVSVSDAGDVNGDGFDDLIIGARQADLGGDANAGKSYVVFGAAGGFGSFLDLSTLDGSNGFRLDGINAGDLSGNSVSNAGDVNGDGFDDLIIGAAGGDPGGNDAAGESYVVFGAGSGFAPALDLSTLDGSNGFRIDGIANGDNAGHSVSGAGDFNGDGFDDLIIGAFGGDPGGVEGAGESYVVFGAAGGFGAALDLSALDGTNGIRLDGIDLVDAAGFSVSSAGDIDGDGFDDLIIGAPGGDPGSAVDAGESYVIFGRDVTGTVAFLGGDANDTLIGTVAAESFVGGLGDDLMIGGGGLDAFRGGAGDDVAVIGPDGALAVDLGSGIDTVNVDALGPSPSLSDNRLVDVEKIDLGGSTANTIVLDRLDVLGLSSTSNTILIKGDAADTVLLEGLWGEGAAVIDPLGETGTYRAFSLGQATVLVESELTATIDFPAVISLADLTGSNGFRLDGIDNNDRSGFSVSGAGDINGDGFDDVIVGAFAASPGGNNEAGESYVVFGAAAGFPDAIDLSTLDGTNGFRLQGIDVSDRSGVSVSDAGDVNGDGFDDLIIGAVYAAPGGDALAGESYVVFGAAGGFAPALDLASLDGTNGFRLDGIDSVDASGYSVSGAGDINGDGFDDVIVGAAGSNGFTGESYVVFGAAGGFAPALDLASLNGSNGFRLDGIDADDYSGVSVSSAGDVNGDGFDDLIIGARQADPGGNGEAGESYVVFGAAGGFAASFDLSTLDGTNGFRLDGIDASDRSGVSVSDAGDVNGDGFDDIIIGAYKASPGGEAYVVFGAAGGFAANIDLSTLDGTNGFRLDGIDPVDDAGWSVSGAGDFNGDGFDDVIIGAVRGDPNGNETAGESYVVFGAAGGFDPAIDLATLDGTNGFRLDGIDIGDRVGRSVSGAGDVNGDGFDDLIVSAFLADKGSIGNAGESYVIFGNNATGAVDVVGTANADILVGTANADIIVAAQGDDTITGDAGDDRMTGAVGDDLFIFADGSGNDTVVDFQAGAGSDDVLDIAAFGFADGADVLTAASQVGDDVVIALDADDSVTLLGVNLAELHDDDFLLV